jgi:hypothetical protein
MASLPRVSSTASELNDFTETSDGKKIYNVRPNHSALHIDLTVTLLTISIGVSIAPHKLD